MRSEMVLYPKELTCSSSKGTLIMLPAFLSPPKALIPLRVEKSMLDDHQQQSLTIMYFF